MVTVNSCRRMRTRVGCSAITIRIFVALCLSVLTVFFTPGRSLAASTWSFAGSIPAQYVSNVSWWDPMVIDPTNANIIYVPIAGVGLLKSTDGGATWNLISTQQVDKIAISPSNPNIIYGGSFYSSTPGPVVKSTDGGVTWTNITNGLPNAANGWTYPAVSAIIIDPNNPNTVYLGLASNCTGVWKTTDGGNSWTFTQGPGCDSYDMATAPSDPNIIYWAGGSPGTGTYVAQTSDGANTWTYPAGAGVGFSNLFGFDIDTIAVDYNNPNTVYASSINGTGLYKSTDGAATWTQISASTVGWKNLVTDPVRANSLYYAAPSGSNVFASSDGGASWSDITNNLPGGILKLEIPASNVNTLYAWTGSGIYTYSLTPPLAVSTTSLPGATLGSAYSAMLAATGGTPPYTWSVPTGSLPPGLSLNASTGVISGTPVLAGTFGFTVQAADSSSTQITATATVSITVGGCATTITGTHSGRLTIGSGVTCLNQATISGPVTIIPGAVVSVVGSALDGPLSASGAASLAVCGSTVSGPASVSSASGLVLFGGTSGSPCGMDVVSGPVTLSGNTGGVILAGSTISGPARITSNSGGALVAANTISGPLSCSGNNPAPTDGGQPNTVKGPATGQCSTLA